MSEKNFMEAQTEIEGMVEKKNQCLTKISNILAEACTSRAKSGKVNSSLTRDISNAIRELPDVDKVEVLMNLSVVLTAQLAGNKTHSKDSSNSSRMSNRNSIFKNRNF